MYTALEKYNLENTASALLQNICIGDRIFINTKDKNKKKLLASSLIKDGVELSNLNLKRIEYGTCIQVKLIKEKKKLFFVPKKVLKMSHTTTHYIN